MKSRNSSHCHACQALALSSQNSWPLLLSPVRHLWKVFLISFLSLSWFVLGHMKRMWLGLHSLPQTQKVNKKVTLPNNYYFYFSWLSTCSMRTSTRSLLQWRLKRVRRLLRWGRIYLLRWSNLSDLNLEVLQCQRMLPKMNENK